MEQNIAEKIAKEITRNIKSEEMNNSVMSRKSTAAAKKKGGYSAKKSLNFVRKETVSSMQK